MTIAQVVAHFPRQIHRARQAPALHHLLHRRLAASLVLFFASEGGANILSKVIWYETPIPATVDTVTSFCHNTETL